MTGQTYTVPCRECGGTGTTSGKSACKRCKGYGMVLSPSPTMDVSK